MGMRRIRLANLSPELTESNIGAAYGEIVSIKDEIWSKAYSYKVSYGVKAITIKLAKRLLSRMNIAGQRAMPSYDGQPVTCYGCGDSGHINQVCPKRRGGGMVTLDSNPNTSAHVAAKGAQNQHGNDDNRIEAIAPERTVRPGIGMFPFWRQPDDHRHPARYWWGAAGPQSPTKA
jgi:hypothetical protein